MIEEGEAKVGIGADAVQAVFGDIGDFIDGVTAQVGKFLRFQVEVEVREMPPVDTRRTFATLDW